MGGWLSSRGVQPCGQGVWKEKQSGKAVHREDGAPARQPSKCEDLSVDRKAGEGVVMLGRAAKENPEEEEKTLVTAETVYVKS